LANSNSSRASQDGASSLSVTTADIKDGKIPIEGVQIDFVEVQPAIAFLSADGWRDIECGHVRTEPPPGLGGDRFLIKFTQPWGSWFIATSYRCSASAGVMLPIGSRMRAVIEPVDPFREWAYFHGFEGFPWPAACGITSALKQAVDGFGRAHCRSCHRQLPTEGSIPGLGQALRIANGEVLGASVRMMDQLASPLKGSGRGWACLQGIQYENWHVLVRLTRQPTIISGETRR